MFGTKTWFQHCRLCISHDSDDHGNVDTVSFNCGRKRTIEDNMHTGSDHPQCSI